MNISQIKRNTSNSFSVQQPNGGVFTYKNKGKNQKLRKKVYVGMSGGVDSSVSALLLKKAGYDVTGVFIRVWQPENSDCGWKTERRDAMRVAAVLDIPFLTFDFSEQYKKEVVDYMISEYKVGRTPNPDIMCNRHVKFGSFLQEAIAQKVDYIATGHYAQSNFDEATNTFVMSEGEDSNKDQTYFLWTLNQNDLQHVLFPIGHLQKSEVRAIAEKYKLPVFDKKDSQGVCFIGHLDMKEFLKTYIDVKKGNVLNTEGAIVGEHDGAILYTEGERHGFTIFNKGEKGTATEPHFIVSKNVKENTITVVPESFWQKRANQTKLDGQDGKEIGEEGKKNTEDGLVKKIKIDRLSFVANAPEKGKTYFVRVRYRQEKQLCTIELVGGIAYITFDKPQKGVAEGQSAVIYDGHTCVGGGIISYI